MKQLFKRKRKSNNSLQIHGPEPPEDVTLDQKKLDTEVKLLGKEMVVYFKFSNIPLNYL